MWAVSQHGAVWGLGEGTLALAAMAAFAGHVWPVFFRFKGGKAGEKLAITWVDNKGEKRTDEATAS